MQEANILQMNLQQQRQMHNTNSSYPENGKRKYSND